MLVIRERGLMSLAMRCVFAACLRRSAGYLLCRQQIIACSKSSANKLVSRFYNAAPLLLNRALRASKIFSIALLSGLSGCALSYTDKSGAEHVIGFVDLSIRPTPKGRLAGDIIEVSTVGVSLLSIEKNSSMAVGYNRITAASFADNALAFGPFDETAFDGFSSVSKRE